VADQPCAQQWSRVQVRVEIVDGKRESLVGNSHLGIATVDVITCELRAGAKVFSFGEAVLTLTACPSEPRNSHPVARSVTLDAIADFYDPAYDFVPKYER
jgi:hypothetical protein